MAKVQNVDLSYKDILSAIESSKQIQESLEKQIELGKEAQKYEIMRRNPISRNPFIRIFQFVMRDVLGIELNPPKTMPEDLQKEIAEQKKTFDIATKNVLSTIQKMEYVRAVQLGMEQTKSVDLTEKYQISDPERFKEILMNEYDNGYRQAMEYNDTPIKSLEEGERDVQNGSKTKLRNEVLQKAYSMQIKIDTGTTIYDADGNYHQKFAADINGKPLEGDLYSQKDIISLKSELDVVSRQIDSLLNTEYKDLLPQIRDLQESARGAGCFLQISQDGILSLSYFEKEGTEHTPYSVSLSDNEISFYKECMENIENRQYELEKEFEEENKGINILTYEDSFPVTDLNEKFDAWDNEYMEDEQSFIDEDMLYDSIYDSMDDMEL